MTYMDLKKAWAALRVVPLKQTIVNVLIGAKKNPFKTVFVILFVAVTTGTMAVPAVMNVVEATPVSQLVLGLWAGWLVWIWLWASGSGPAGEFGDMTCLGFIFGGLLGAISIMVLLINQSLGAPGLIGALCVLLAFGILWVNSIRRRRAQRA